MYTKSVTVYYPYTNIITLLLYMSLKVLIYLSIALDFISNSLTNQNCAFFTLFFTSYQALKSYNKISYMSHNSTTDYGDSIPSSEYFISIISLMMLLISGTVERNPGPNETLDINCFSVFHQNIRSIGNKMEYIKDNWLEYNILCFTETYLCNTINNELLTLDDYPCFYRKDSTCHSSGLLTYMSENFTVWTYRTGLRTRAAFTRIPLDQDQ
jgi:hypothetical protein